MLKVLYIPPEVWQYTLNLIQTLDIEISSQEGFDDEEESIEDTFQPSNKVTQKS